jgi:ATP-dependent helicase/nuclease subunit A
MKLLAGPEPTGRSVPLRPGSLFVVGDPKQSIYRFRRADIDIYNIGRARLMDPSCGEVLPLTTNFRSVPALCKWANEVFRLQFPSEPHRSRLSSLPSNLIARLVKPARQASSR